MSKDIPSIYLDLENPVDLLKVQDIRSFHAANSTKMIILDEVQRFSQLFREIWGIIDEERRKGRKNKQFLFLGSASVDLLQQSGESLAERIVYTELYPINVLEYGAEKPDDLNTFWLRGGFPESLLLDDSIDSISWRKDFIRT